MPSHSQPELPKTVPDGQVVARSHAGLGGQPAVSCRGHGDGDGDGGHGRRPRRRATMTSGCGCSDGASRSPPPRAGQGRAVPAGGELCGGATAEREAHPPRRRRADGRTGPGRAGVMAACPSPRTQKTRTRTRAASLPARLLRLQRPRTPVGFPAAGACRRRRALRVTSEPAALARSFHAPKENPPPPPQRNPLRIESRRRRSSMCGFSPRPAPLPIALASMPIARRPGTTSAAAAAAAAVGVGGGGVRHRRCGGGGFSGHSQHSALRPPPPAHPGPPPPRTSRPAAAASAAACPGSHGAVPPPALRREGGGTAP